MTSCICVLQVVAAYGSVPFPMMHGGCLPDALDAFADVLPWRPISACPELGGGHCFDQSVTLRGLDGQSLVRSEEPFIYSCTFTDRLVEEH